MLFIFIILKVAGIGLSAYCALIMLTRKLKGNDDALTPYGKKARNGIIVGAFLSVATFLTESQWPDLRMSQPEKIRPPTIEEKNPAPKTNDVKEPQKQLYAPKNTPDPPPTDEGKMEDEMLEDEFTNQFGRQR